VRRHTVTGQKDFAALSRDTRNARVVAGTNRFWRANSPLGDLPPGDYELLSNLTAVPRPTLSVMIHYRCGWPSKPCQRRLARCWDVWEPKHLVTTPGQTLTIKRRCKTNSRPTERKFGVKSPRSPKLTTPGKAADFLPIRRPRAGCRRTQTAAQPVRIRRRSNPNSAIAQLSRMFHHGRVMRFLVRPKRSARK